VNIFTVPSEAIDIWRPMLLPHLKRFEAETQRATAESLLDHAKRGEKQVWGLHTGEHIAGVVVTEIYTAYRGQACRIWAAVGTAESSAKDETLLLYAAIEKWARELGCVSMEIVGRKGWLRWLPGYEQTAVVMEKQL
jgi:hypothetical protein